MHALQVSALSVVMVDAEIMKGYVARDSFEMKRVNASKHYSANPKNESLSPHPHRCPSVW